MSVTGFLINSWRCACVRGLGSAMLASCLQKHDLQHLDFLSHCSAAMLWQPHPISSQTYTSTVRMYAAKSDFATNRTMSAGLFVQSPSMSDMKGMKVQNKASPLLAPRPAWFLSLVSHVSVLTWLVEV